MLLKQLEDLSDETLIDRWVRDLYYHYLFGMEQFRYKVPCDPTELVYFRRRIGEIRVSLGLTPEERRVRNEVLLIKKSEYKTKSI